MSRVSEQKKHLSADTTPTIAEMIQTLARVVCIPLRTIVVGTPRMNRLRHHLVVSENPVELRRTCRNNLHHHPCILHPHQYNGAMLAEFFLKTKHEDPTGMN
jgi:hypothetical protein